MDGYDFLKALRRMPGGDRPKVVFCTTENDVGAHCPRAPRRCQRIHHEALRPRHRRSQVSGSRVDLISVLFVFGGAYCDKSNACRLRSWDPVAIRPVKVMVVDDSAIARGFIRRWVETESLIWRSLRRCRRRVKR